jgi:tetratricopeptide (TPR) repeat protein
LHGGPEKAPGWIVANLGSALAALGRWENAIKSLEQGIENGGLASEMLAYRHLALSLLAAGRMGDYEALRLKLVQLYGATQNATQAHDTAHILLLRPFPPEVIMKPSKPMVTSKDALDLAIRATFHCPNNGLYAGTLGAALYRANRNPEAPQFLRQTIEAQEKNGQFDLPRERLYFAMAENARGRAGNWELARAEFDRAKEWLDKISASPPSSGGAATHPWDLLLEVGLLVKEAQQEFTKTAPSAP